MAHWRGSSNHLVPCQYYGAHLSQICWSTRHTPQDVKMRDKLCHILLHFSARIHLISHHGVEGNHAEFFYIILYISVQWIIRKSGMIWYIRNDHVEALFMYWLSPKASAFYITHLADQTHYKIRMCNTMKIYVSATCLFRWLKRQPYKVKCVCNIFVDFVYIHLYT